MMKSASRNEQIRSLENGHGLQYLLNAAYQITGNPVVLFDMEYKLLACTENIVTDDPLWNELVETGVFSDETIAFFKNECFVDTVASAKTIALLRSDKLPYDRLYGRVFNSDSSTVADLVMVACTPLEEDDPAAFEVFCEKLSGEIRTSAFYRQYGILYHETLICKLLDGDTDDKVIYSDHLANLYEGLKTNLFAAVADVSKCPAKNRGPEAFRDELKKMNPEFKYAVYAGYIVMIISADDPDLSAERHLGQLGVFFERNNIYAGISRRFDNLFDLRKYYDEAV
ncbi:MAG: hypothetical protein LBL15_08045, partial [Oscillospiraceae bacterium]|nr:hypothetical protein [Oscillospiraceae bacterium]